VFLEIIFGKEQEITASASDHVTQLISMIISDMLLQLMCMQSLELTLVTLELHEIHIRCTHRCSKNTARNWYLDDQVPKSRPITLILGYNLIAKLLQNTKCTAHIAKWLITSDHYQF